MKKISHAISEAFACSDVPGIKTTAKKSRTASTILCQVLRSASQIACLPTILSLCRADKGFCVLLILRSERLITKPIKTSYSAITGTAYMQFDKSIVPVDHLPGKENKGLVVNTRNLSNERFAMICGSIRGNRGIVEECLKWCNQRVVFKRNLSGQPVIRAKLAKIMASAEAAQAWLEKTAEHMVRIRYREQDVHLVGGGIINLTVVQMWVIRYSDASH